MRDLLDIFKALSDETRIRIINLLYEKELCVCDILHTLNIPQTKTSRHLACLKHAGLVADRQQAQWVYYSLIKDENTNFIDSLIHNKFRKIEQFQLDLENLKEWQKSKERPCD